MSEHAAAAVQLKVAGAELPATVYDALVDVRVEQSILLPDQVTLRIRDQDFQLFDDEVFALGAPLDVTFVGQKGVAAIAVRAEVTAVGVEPGPGGRHELVVNGLDRGHRLARGTEVATYQNVKDSDVARAVAQRFGLKADVQPTPTSHEYLLQCGTAYAFLCERAQKAGARWWVTDGTLVFKPTTEKDAPDPLVWGENLQRFKARCSAIEVSDGVAVRGWDATRQQALTGEAALAADLEAVGSDAPAAAQVLSGAKKSGAFTGKRFLGATPVADASEADALAKAMALRASGEHFSARGQAIGDPLIYAGSHVKVEGVGTRLTGTYVLSTVEHVWGIGQPYVTRFTTGGRTPKALPDLLGAGNGTAGATLPPWGLRGLVVGIVTNVRDPEKCGRVKVRYPTLSDQDESAWARVLAPGAGKTRGFQTPFEVDDEVLVGFEHGDLRRPIVLGGVWSGRNTAPWSGERGAGQGTVTSKWQTRGGQIIELNDAPQPTADYILLVLGDNTTKLRIGGDGVTLHTPKGITITADQGISVTAKGDLTLEGANVNVKARAKLAMQAAMVEAKATGPLNVQGATAEVKGTAIARVDGGALAEIKGGMVKLN